MVGKDRLVGKLTAKQVEGLTEPGRYTDGDGLMLRVDAQGRRYWELRYRFDDKRRDLSLGPERTMSLREAREAASDARADIRKGIDPIAKRKAVITSAITFAELAREVHASLRKGWRNGKHCEQWLATLENHAFPLIGDEPVAALTRADMVKVLDPIWLLHQETARRVLQRMRTVIRRAEAKNIRQHGIDFELVRQTLPRQRRKVKHMAAVHFTDARAFMDALAFAKAGPVVRSALEFMILTSARPGNIRFMEWSDVFIEEAVWNVSAEKMKMDESHPVPLPPRAVKILRAMKAFRSPDADWVFPGDKPQQPMSENTLCQAIRDMGYKATAHGFRSTFKDWSRAAQYPDMLSEFQLAHIDENETRKAYGRDGQLALRREMMEHWANTLAGRVPMPKHEQVPMAA